MTEQEAKEYGEEYLYDLTRAVCKVEDKHKDFVRLSIEALEKQIPKKPLPIITDDNEFICVICPSCQEIAVEVDDSYCRRCGQALDWGNEE